MDNRRSFINSEEVSYVSRQDYSEKIALQRLVQYDIMVRQKDNNIAPISDQQRSEILAFWRKKMMWHTDLLNMRYYDVYNAVEKDKSKLKYYIPDSFFYAFVDEYFTNPQRSTALDDKNLYDLYFADVNRPKTIVRKLDDVFQNERYEPISIDEFVSRCKEEGEVVVKSAICSFGGHGVLFWNAKKDSVETLLDFVYRRNAEFFNGSSVYKQYIVQGLLRQHPAMAAINPTSVNTVRVMTLFRNGKVLPLSSVLRMGIGGSRVDNCSSGGIVCGITDDGHLKDVAYDGAANKFHTHPQGYKFSGEEVPGFSECVELAKKLSYRFYGASRLISWDFAVDEEAHPVLIEMNISFGELDFHQLCNGPIFGEDTMEIIGDVLDNNYTYRELNKKKDIEGI